MNKFKETIVPTPQWYHSTIDKYMMSEWINISKTIKVFDIKRLYHEVIISPTGLSL